MGYPFEIKNIDDGFCIFDCPTDWLVSEMGSIFHRVYFVYDGIALYEDNKQKFKLERGYVYIFPTYKPYTITHNPKQPFKCLYFHITMSPIILNSVISFNLHNNFTAYNLYQSIEYTIVNRKDYKKENILIEEMLHSLLYLISLKETFQILNDTILEKVTAYIHNHYTDDLTNDYLAHISGYNISYFTRLFKKIYSISPQKYLLNYRIIKAIGLIRDKLPISVVSSMVGYHDVKAFCRAFKRIKGVPPSEYKKSQFLQP
jgi:AraC-like DNA-binding protein